jgi:transcription termination/antitermination protein NusA
VGMRGVRIQNVVNELSGEKIDVVQWDADPAVFVANALSPAQVVSVTIAEDENTARVIVPERQLSLAIGKEGQNARLAAKLTGWRIDIRSDAASVPLLSDDEHGNALENPVATAVGADEGSETATPAAMDGVPADTADAPATHAEEPGEAAQTVTAGAAAPDNGMGSAG